MTGGCGGGNGTGGGGTGASNGGGGGGGILHASGSVVSGDQESVLGWRRRATGSFSMDGTSDAGTTSTAAAGARAALDSRRNMTLQQLQRAIKSIMLTDGEMYAKLQAGLQGIGSLARETTRLTVNRDLTGATCINQYVVVKTLGRGSYGKVKLCLNTVDGQLYAIKVGWCVCVQVCVMRVHVHVRMCVPVRVRVCMCILCAHVYDGVCDHACVCVRACMRAGACMSPRACACVFRVGGIRISTL
jgi:hypothetical protein